MKPHRGLLIAIEGIDGAGTTTQAQLLAQWMNQQQHDDWQAHLTCEPSSGPVGALVREALRHKIRPLSRGTLALLFAADRLDHLRDEVQPQLQRGVHVVTDRYVYSSLAYQSLDLDLSWVAQINRRAPEPDLTVYLRVSAQLAEDRRQGRAGAPEEFENLAEQERICSQYDALFGSTPDAGVWRLDPKEVIDYKSLDCGAPSEILPDPAWIHEDPVIPDALRQVGRDPCWAVVPGEQPADTIHQQLCALVQAVHARAVSNAKE